MQIADCITENEFSIGVTVECPYYLECDESKRCHCKVAGWLGIDRFANRAFCFGKYDECAIYREYVARMRFHDFARIFTDGWTRDNPPGV